MKMFRLFACLMMLVLASPSLYGQTSVASATSEQKLTQEQEKTYKAMLKQNLKAFDDASLSQEQHTKAEEVLGKALKEVVIKRDAVKITQELQKKQAAAVKEARESGKKGKAQADTAFAAAGFNEEQIKVFKETQEIVTKAKKEIGKALKPEQIAKLPEQLQKTIQSTK